MCGLHGYGHVPDTKQVSSLPGVKILPVGVSMILKARKSKLNYLMSGLPLRGGLAQM